LHSAKAENLSNIKNNKVNKNNKLELNIINRSTKYLALLFFIPSFEMNNQNKPNQKPIFNYGYSPFSYRTVQNVLVWSKQCLRANELAAKKGYF